MQGRWPANVILSPEMAEALDAQSGDRPTSKPGSVMRRTVATSSSMNDDLGLNGRPEVAYGDSGGASRFFLNAGYEPWELEWIYQNGLRPCGTEEL